MNRFNNENGNFTPETIANFTDAELAAAIREGAEWDGDLLRDLLWRADLLEAYEKIDPDSADPEKAQWDLIYKAAETLGVEIE